MKKQDVVMALPAAVLVVLALVVAGGTLLGKSMESTARKAVTSDTIYAQD